MKPLKVTCSIVLHHSRLLTAKNADKIVARALRPSDPCGNSLPSPIDRYRNAPPYFQLWRIKKEGRGFAFVEETHGGGICGSLPTVRALVRHVALNHACGIVVEVAP